MVNKLEVSISRYKWRPATPWKADISARISGGKRIRKFFQTKTEAIAWADDFIGKTISCGVGEALADNQRSVASALDDYMAAKMPEAGPREKSTLKLADKRIREAFKGLPLSSVTVSRVEKWLSSKDWSRRTRWNAFSYLRTFFRWCVRRNYIDAVPFEAMSEEMTKPSPPICIISPSEMNALLRITRRNPLERADICCGAFAGIRTEEALKMKADDFHFQDLEIYISPLAIKKTDIRGGAKERYIKMTEAFQRHFPRNLSGNLIQPMNPDRGESTFRQREKSLYLRRKRIAGVMFRFVRRFKPAGWHKWNTWPDNCLRHTFASCLLATKKDAWYVAHQIGHSNTKTIYQHYARAIKEKDAEAYFAL